METIIKNTLYEFDPVIYPRRLWIAIGEDKFEDRFEDVSEMDKNADAQVDSAFDKINTKGGVLIRFENVDAIRCGNITHESIHAAWEIFNYVGAKADNENQEPFCYLAGWISKCIGIVYEELTKM